MKLKLIVIIVVSLVTLGFSVNLVSAQSSTPICNRNFPNTLTKNLFENSVGCACGSSSVNPSYYNGADYRYFTYYDWSTVPGLWGPSQYCRYPGDPFNPPSTAVGKVEYCADLDEGRFWWRSSLQQYYTGHLQGRYASLLDFAAIKQRNGPNVPENQRQEFLFCEDNDWHECSTNQNCAYQPKGYGHSEATSKCLVNKYSPPGRRTCHFFKDIELEPIDGSLAINSSPAIRIIFLVNTTGRPASFNGTEIAEKLAVGVANTEPFQTIQKEKGLIQFSYIAGNISTQIPPNDFERINSSDTRWRLSDESQSRIKHYISSIMKGDGNLSADKQVYVYVDASNNLPSSKKSEIADFAQDRFIYMVYRTPEENNKVLTHELGHTFSLDDEYEYKPAGVVRIIKPSSDETNVILQAPEYDFDEFPINRGAGFDDRGWICRIFNGLGITRPNCYSIYEDYIDLDPLDEDSLQLDLVFHKSTENSVMNNLWIENRYNVVSCAYLLKFTGYETNINSAVRKCQTPPVSLGVIQNENQ